MTAGGRSRSKIGQGLNRDGIATKNGKRWSPAQIGRIVTSPHLLGRTKHGDQVGEPLIDEATWLAAKRIAAEDQKWAARGCGRRSGGLAGKGLARCGNCGSFAMHYRAPGYAPAFYECTSVVYEGTSACPRIPAAPVDDLLCSLVLNLHIDLEASRDLLIARADRGVADVEKSLASAERELLNVQAKRERLDRDYDSGKLEVDLYARRNREHDEGEQAARAERERLRSHLEALREVPAAIDDVEFSRRIQALADAVSAGTRDAANLDDLDALRAAIRRVYERVEVGVDDRGAIDVKPVLHPWLLATQDVDTGEWGYQRIPLHLSSGDSGHGPM